MNVTLYHIAQLYLKIFPTQCGNVLYMNKNKSKNKQLNISWLKSQKEVF